MVAIEAIEEEHEMIRYQKNRLILENNSKELLEKESGGLPFVCNFNESHVFIGHHIPWHWHDWFEINYTERGSFHLQTADQVVEYTRERPFISMEVSFTHMTFRKTAATTP